MGATRNSKVTLIRECATLLFCIALVAVGLGAIWQQVHWKKGTTIAEYGNMPEMMQRITNWFIALITIMGGGACGAGSVNRIRKWKSKQ